jgi:N-methylhydantoinase B/oxoprolinase/acetone carboxylase alpha subunit
MKELDAFTIEVLRSYLLSTVREMAIATTRTAYSTCFAQGEDFTCGLFDATGRMIAQDQGVPVHAGALEDAVQHIRSVAGVISEGDVFIHNDPYNGGTHQADGLVCRPIYAEGALRGFAVNRGHWTDMGGMAPGGWSGAAEDVFQEALIVPAIRLFSAGEVVDDVKSMLLRNVRLPRQLWGDIQSQIAAAVIAERRIGELIRRYGLVALKDAMEAAVVYSRRRFLAGLRAIPDGVVEAQDVIEDNARGDGPFTIRVRVTKRPDGVTVDFTGTDPQAASPINSTLACTKAGVIAPLIAITDPETPLNAGVTSLIEIIAPSGTLVHPTSPAPTFGATADPSDRVAETVLRALALLAPERVIAGSYSTGNNVTGGSIESSGKTALWYSYQSGGCGARHGHDGNSAEWHLMSNSKNESMEVWETRYPIEFLEYALIQDSGGPGRWRGGLGTIRRSRITAPTRLSGISDHHFNGAHGLAGGKPGLPNGFRLERHGEKHSLQEVYGLLSPSKFANLPLKSGDVFVSIQGGGGGYGDPTSREAAAIAVDLREGYVSDDHVAIDYKGTRNQPRKKRGARR